MIIVKITMTALPEKRKEVSQTLLSIIEDIRLEKGCLNYGIFQCMEDENVFCMVGEWTTREDLERHLKSDKFGVLLGTKILLDKHQDIEIHTVLHSEDKGAVNAVRGRRI
jgi:quinol monooxygenase YgiN